MTQSFRLESGGLINRDKKITFKFNGKNYFGYEGDTLASALIANGVHLIGRSFKYHRPRGFFGAGVDEPYAIVQLYRNCLLYTSPSPRDRRLSRMPSSA